MDRRTVLATLGIVLTGPLAGCGGGGGGDGSPTPTPTDARTPEPTPTDEPTPTEVTATAAPTATPADDTATPPPTATPAGAAVVVDVGDGGFRFEPDTFEVTTGDTVVWVWRSSNHNVVPNSIPDGSDWTGTAGGAGTTYDAGHEHRFTFGTPGRYTYYCAPHRSAGMTGSFDVVE